MKVLEVNLHPVVAALLTASASCAFANATSAAPFGSYQNSHNVPTGGPGGVKHWCLRHHCDRYLHRQQTPTATSSISSAEVRFPIRPTTR